MTSDAKKYELSNYRIKQAEESIDEAEFLLSGGKSPRSIINRAYYAMFYAVLALLVHESYATSKHTGVLAYFNKKFIKEGLLSESLGLAINKAFDLRQRSDYREYVELSHEQATHFIGEAKIFVSTVKDYIASRRKPETTIDS